MLGISSSQYTKDYGPLGKAPEISVGASDSLLLGVSIAGFALMAYTIYSIILTKVKSSKELEDEENERSFEDQLAQADVSTLTRAQRRARARHIAKQQRRVASGLGEMERNEQQPEDQNVPPMEEDTHHAGTLRHLSRKERQKAAKEIEMKERIMLQDQRHREQLEAQEEACRRKKEKEKQAEADRKKQQEQRKAEELAAYNAWRIFLPPYPKLSGGTDSNFITVKEWIRELKYQKMVDISVLSRRFEVSEQLVRGRIQELLDTDQVTGFLEDESFTYLSTMDMNALASFAESQDKFYCDDIQKELPRLLAG